MSVKRICDSHFPCVRSTVYDTEQVTSLDLVSEVASKTNELVDEFNDLDTKVGGFKSQIDSNTSGVLSNKTEIDKLDVKVDSNTDQIDFLTDQFASGATGQVIDGGIAGVTEIDKIFDGGVV